MGHNRIIPNILSLCLGILVLGFCYAELEIQTETDKSSKILNNGRPPPNIPQSPNQIDLSSQGSGPSPNYQNQPSSSSSNNGNRNGIPDIYIQIVGAIEKLVGRMDKLDARLRTVESISLHFITNKEKEKPVVDQPQGNCPMHFTKIDGIVRKCYHISSFSKPTMVYDWKSAATECSKLGGRLVEMITYDDFLRISQFLAKYSNTRNSVSTDFWTGGINPGLLWIWAESGVKVDMDRRFWNENDNNSNAPGCLKLSYSVRLNTFFFKASPCSHPHNYLCEIMDNAVARALAQFEQQVIFADTVEFVNATDTDNQF